ncbi:alpha/beta hydrolase-fold protein [Niabella ginsengisoli]|uniref:Alpha/beta hydrolase-fold protein n=1 Tax=Niabella ginsengisoli TaxID=522298 RepID=A0ABS9SR26_9BACT|nr:alpha/beta hydrolase-fold protein [Niabella ginsengisoli]MCH5600681.1 alpha/beta hydrolase-fold protein [Niabella ginsengisoli]
METTGELQLVLDAITLPSKQLKRDVELRLYLPKNVADTASMSLLLINDGQDMAAMGFDKILNELYTNKAIEPVLAVAITAGKDRMQEYGVAKKKDYLGRGAKAGAFTKFILNELIPFVKKHITFRHLRKQRLRVFL